MLYHANIFFLLINITCVYFISKMQKKQQKTTFLKLHVKLELVRLEVKWLTQLYTSIGGSYVRGTRQLSKQLTINVLNKFLEPVTACWRLVPLFQHKLQVSSVYLAHAD